MSRSRGFDVTGDPDIIEVVGYLAPRRELTTLVGPLRGHAFVGLNSAFRLLFVLIVAQRHKSKAIVRGGRSVGVVPA